MNKEQIRKLTEQGYQVVCKAVAVWNGRRGGKYHLHFRAEKGDSYCELTKYQAIAHLNDSTKSNVELFERVFRLKNQKDMPISKRIEANAELRELRADVRFQTAIDCIDNREPVYL